MWLFITWFMINGIIVLGETPVAKITVTQTKEINYYLLTKGDTLKIKVKGPTWLRVYTRIIWHPDMGETATYKIIVEEDDLTTKVIRKTTERSNNSHLNGKPISKWRSFYVYVPPDTHTYRFYLWKAPSDTMLVRFRFQAPRPWTMLTPISYIRQLEAIERERIVTYYTGDADTPVVIKVDGPNKLKVVSRLLLDYTAIGRKVYTITIYEGEKVLKRITHVTCRSETVTFKDEPRFVPSVAGVTYLDIAKGTHILRILPNPDAGEVGFIFYVKGD